MKKMVICSDVLHSQEYRPFPNGIYLLLEFIKGYWGVSRRLCKKVRRGNPQYILYNLFRYSLYKGFSRHLLVFVNARKYFFTE